MAAGRYQYKGQMSDIVAIFPSWVQRRNWVGRHAAVKLPGCHFTTTSRLPNAFSDLSGSPNIWPDWLLPGLAV